MRPLDRIIELQLPVVDGEGQIVSRRRQTIPSSPDGGGGEVPGGHDGTPGYLGKHLGSEILPGSTHCSLERGEIVQKRMKRQSENHYW